MPTHNSTPICHPWEHDTRGWQTVFELCLTFWKLILKSSWMAFLLFIFFLTFDWLIGNVSLFILHILCSLATTSSCKDLLLVKLRAGICMENQLRSLPMSAYMDPHGYPYHGGQHLRTMPPNLWISPILSTISLFLSTPRYHYTPPTYPYSNPYPIYNPPPYTISYVHEKEKSLSFIAENINNQLYHVMREIDPKCELPTKTINPHKWSSTS